MTENIKLEYLESKTGSTTLKINNYFVHSKYNPQREAQQLVENNYMPHHLHIVFGYGCGYVVQELIKRRAFLEKIIVIDPLFNDNILNVKHRDQNLYFFDSSILPILERYINTIASEARVSFKTFCTPNYDKIFPEIYKSLLIKIKDTQYKNRTNDYTIIRYAKEWQRNSLHNLLNLYSDVNINELEKKYSCPVVVASGGPSLTKQISLLKEIRDSIILICAGSTINSLLSNGIEPDYLVSIDGGEPNYKHFKDLHLQNTEIMYSMQHHYKINESFEKRGYVFGTHGSQKLNEFIKEQLFYELPILEMGGSVAHTAFNIAHYITTGPVALIGQDLAYTDNFTHAASNKNARLIDEEFIKKNEAFKTEGYDGNKIWTNPVFYSMKMDFEDILVANPPTVPIFNCTEGGIKLNGFKQIPFKNFIEEFVDKDEKVQVVNCISNNKKINLKQVLNNLQDNLYDLESMLEEGLVLIEKSIDSKSEINNKTHSKLNKIEKKVQKMINKLPIEAMTSSITINILKNFLPNENESPEELYNRVMAQTKNLYSDLLEAVQFTNQCIVDVMEKSTESGG